MYYVLCLRMTLLLLEHATMCLRILLRVLFFFSVSFLPLACLFLPTRRRQHPAALSETFPCVGLLRSPSDFTRHTTTPPPSQLQQHTRQLHLHHTMSETDQQNANLIPDQKSSKHAKRRLHNERDTKERKAGKHIDVSKSTETRNANHKRVSRRRRGSGKSAHIRRR